MPEFNNPGRTAAKLRRIAAMISAPRVPVTVTLAPEEITALNAVKDLGEITGVVTTFDGSGRIFTGLFGSFVIEAHLERLLRSKGLLTGAGRLTRAAQTAMDDGAFTYFKPGRLPASAPRAYREEAAR